jgi:hypothetical protein
LVEDQVRVEGVLFTGLAERLQVGARAVTVIAVQLALQLLPSFDSLMTPKLPAELLSAHARIYQVPPEGKEYEREAVLEPPAGSAALAYVPMSVALLPLLSVARWKRSVKPAPVADVGPLEITAESVIGTFTVADPPLTLPAVRSGWPVHAKLALVATVQSTPLLFPDCTHQL